MQVKREKMPSLRSKTSLYIFVEKSLEWRVVLVLVSLKMRVGFDIFFKCNTFVFTEIFLFPCFKPKQIHCEKKTSIYPFRYTIWKKTKVYRLDPKFRRYFFWHRKYRVIKVTFVTWHAMLVRVCLFLKISGWCLDYYDISVSSFKRQSIP